MNNDLKNTIGNYEDNYDNFKKDMAKVREVKGDIKELLTKVCQVVNPKLRCYYNFSINSFYELVEGCKDYKEFCLRVKDMDAHYQYSFSTLKEYNEFLTYLLEENDIKLHDSVVNRTLKLNDNLFVMVEELNSKHWI